MGYFPTSTAAELSVTLSVVIFTRDDSGHLGRCLASLCEDPPESLHEVIVVDNASRDDSLQVVESFAAKLPVQVIALEAESSFSAGNNRGMERATGECILFLNPDTLPTAAVLGRCLEVLGESPSAGLVGPLLVYPGGEHQGNGWFLPDPLQLLSEHLRLARREVPRSPDGVSEVGWLMGCFLMGRREQLLDLGGFDEDFWFHGTDLELCARVAANGYRVLRIEDLRMVHVGHRAWDARRRRAAHEALVRYTRREHGALAARGVGSLARLAEVLRP